MTELTEFSLDDYVTTNVGNRLKEGMIVTEKATGKPVIITNNKLSSGYVIYKGGDYGKNNPISLETVDVDALVRFTGTPEEFEAAENRLMKSYKNLRGANTRNRNQDGGSRRSRKSRSRKTMRKRGQRARQTTN